MTAWTASTPNPSQPPIFDGCAEHHVGTMDVNRRWHQVEAIVSSALADDQAAQWSKIAMCWCCYGPALVDFIDARGIGWGSMLCTRCLA